MLRALAPVIFALVFILSLQPTRVAAEEGSAVVEAQRTMFCNGIGAANELADILAGPSPTKSNLKLPDQCFFATRVWVALPYRADRKFVVLEQLREAVVIRSGIGTCWQLFEDVHIWCARHPKEIFAFIWRDELDNQITAIFGST